MGEWIARSGIGNGFVHIIYVYCHKYVYMCSVMIVGISIRITVEIRSLIPYKASGRLCLLRLYPPTVSLVGLDPEAGFPELFLIADPFIGGCKPE